MAANEDCASVLEQFIHDVANLPAEINHMMEEIQAKDRDMQKYQSIITAKDGNLQKHIKLNGSLPPHPKEKEYADTIMKHYEVCQDLQEQKIALSDKACILLDRQIKKLDVKIRELQNDGQLADGPAIPSLFNRKTQNPDPKSTFYSDIPPHNTPLQITSGNAAAGIHNANLGAHRMNSQHHPSVPSRISQMAVSNTHVTPRPSAPATPAATVQQSQRVRESSAGAASDANKRRRLNASLTAGIPAQGSSLRQSSLGPNTPKAGTPSGNTVRAGSLPRSSAMSQQSNSKKVGLSKKVFPQNQQVSKLKGKPGKRPSGLKKGQSPSMRSRGGTADDDESVLSSADVSEAETVGSRSRRGGARQKKSLAEPEVEEDVEMEGADEAEDTNLYCFCHAVSYGESMSSLPAHLVPILTLILSGCL